MKWMSDMLARNFGGADFQDYFGAAERGDVNKLRVLLAKHPQWLFTRKTEVGGDALTFAATAGKLEAVLFLLEKGADPNATFKNGLMDKDSGFNQAVANGHIEVVRALIKYGANVNSATGSVWNPLRDAVESGRKDLIQLLLDAGISCNSYGALSHAIKSGNEEVMAMLIKGGANPRVTNYLFDAIQSGKVSVIEYFLRKVDIDVHSTGGVCAWTPLICAISTGNNLIVDYLLKRGANPWLLETGPLRRAPLDFCKNEQARELLLKQIALWESDPALARRKPVATKPESPATGSP